MFCPRCQAASPAGGRFCAQCGAPLPASDAVQRSSRRQMTVLFCDLVGSTELAQRCDPDDWLAALQQYHDLVRRVSARYGGFVARIVGDGVDVYFGYPLANEDDAARALHTGLNLAAELPRIEVEPGVPLSLRIGIATGMVAVSVGQGVAVAGPTPNLAARIQAAVPPGAIGVAPSTRHIAGGQFEFAELGEHALKGFEAPVAINVVRRALSQDSRSAWRGRDTRLPMVGRRAELNSLQAIWQRASAGRTCGALVLGEPGLGKSRLVTALDLVLPAQGHTMLRLQCSPFHVNSALQPFVQHLAVAAGLSSSDSNPVKLDKLEAQLAIGGIEDPSDCALIAALLGVASDGRYPALAMPPPMQLQLIKEALKHYFSGLAHQRLSPANEQTLTRYFVGHAEERPLLLVIEDMHWVDPTSLELIEQLLASGDDASILLLMTARHDFSSRWQDGENFLQLVLQRLPDEDAFAVAAQQLQQADLPPQWLAAIIERTDGVPLFIEEMTHMLLERRAAPSGAVGLGHAVPETLVDLLTERLDRLPAAAKELAQVAAVIGREFDRELLFAAAPELEGGLQAALQAMLDSGLLLSGSADGERLLFKHALVEDTAYGSVPAKRCAEIHGRLADVLLSQFKTRVHHQPELAARHLSRAGRGLEAAAWWQAAGGQALSRGAPREAAGHLRAGVAALGGVAASAERDRAELGLLSMLGPTTMVLLGPGSDEFGSVQQRAYELSQTLPGQPLLFPTSYAWCLFNWGRARLVEAGELADGLLLAAALRAGETEAALAAHTMAGMVQFHRGQPEAARAHLSQSTALYEPQRDAALYPVYLMDFGVFGRFYLALATQVLGFADAARRIAAEALLLAEGLNQPHTLGFAMLANFNTAVMRGDAAEALPMAERCIEFSSQFGFPEFIAMARIARGWAWAHGQARWAEGLAELQAGIAGWAETGFENWQTWFAVLEAEMLGQLGQHGAALALMERQLARVAANGEHQFESLLLGERAAALAALPGRSAEAKAEAQAEANFESAAALAREQGAAAWSQRIASRRAQVLPQ
ncbi:ATP-binding protein [Roseateles albus]|uniref:Adenylate/guanylate cyclase domain-containing protein n=1 Tax=Roseateles albus TaxID=2987525 RepID=A0ABT5KAJ3_9BURK|nr:adenylate/guanylate cyclase domain-containing protein [Roseateles albus]MDC8770584.1 adenylate/guanylate cyclase domain-containing protein [Roseateles albus]